MTASRMSRMPRFLLALTVVVALCAVIAGTMNHNASYLLFVAGRVLNGARLYVDFPEINPPLIIWLNMPVAWLAQHAGLPDAYVFRFSVCALALASVAASGAILRNVLATPDFWAWHAMGVYVTIAAPGYSFGEREHIALLCVLPYLAEATRRMQGAPCSRGVQLAAALLAALGLGLKPHFLLAPMLIESSFMLKARRGPTAATIIAVAALAAYAGAVYWLSPNYFDMLRLLSTTYWNYADSWTGFVQVPEFMGAALLATIAWMVGSTAPALFRTVSLAALGFALAAIIQHKGWSYHWYPVLALCWLLFGLAVAKAVAYRQAASPVIITALAVIVSAWSLQQAIRGRDNPNPALLAPAIRELGGGPVIVFSSFEASYPLVTMPGIGTSTRFPTMTILSATIHDRNARALRWIQQSFVSDFRRQPPRLLLVETGPDGVPVFDFVGYFTPFVPELASYRPVRQVGKFQVLQAPDAQQRRFGRGL